MVHRSPELQDALRRLARAATTHERKMATQDVNRLRYPGLDPQPGRKGGGDDHDRTYGIYDDAYPSLYSRRGLRR